MSLVNLRQHFDSSKTRVVPTFDAISRQEGWVRRLLELPRGGTEERRETRGDLTPVPGGCHWGDRPHGLVPPVSLLSWLIRNARGRVPEDGSETARARRHLAEGDPAWVEAALTALRTHGPGRGWHVLERRAYPDVFVVTPDLLLVVEGKRTESPLGTAAPPPHGRHPIWRHVDAAWEIRGRREVVGVLVVEGDDAGEVPPVWKDAVQASFGADVLEASFPHRSSPERDEIVRSFWGVTTWQTVCRHFGLEASAVLVESL